MCTKGKETSYLPNDIYWKKFNEFLSYGLQLARVFLLSCALTSESQNLKLSEYSGKIKKVFPEVKKVYWYALKVHKKQKEKKSLISCPLHTSILIFGVKSPLFTLKKYNSMSIFFCKKTIFFINPIKNIEIWKEKNPGIR